MDCELKLVAFCSRCGSVCGGEQPWKGEVLPQGSATHTHT